MLSQMQELACRAQDAMEIPWKKKGVGRKKSCGLHAAVEIACMYLRHNVIQEFLGDMKGISQPTVSRIITAIVTAGEIGPGAIRAVRRIRPRDGERQGLPGRRHDHALLVLAGLITAGLSNRANGAVGLFGSYGIFGEVVFGGWEALADA
jgi:hypothetical protein